MNESVQPKGREPVRLPETMSAIGVGVPPAELRDARPFCTCQENTTCSLGAITLTVDSRGARVRHIGGDMKTSKPPRNFLLVCLALLLASIANGASGLARSSNSQTRSGFGVRPTIPPSQQGEKKVRREPAGQSQHSAKRLLDELRPDDEVLEVIDWQPAPSLEPPPPGETPLSMLAKESEVVALVTVVGTSGRMRPDGRWIRTQVNARIDQLLKPSTSLESRDAIEFLTPGGAVNFKGTSGKEQEVRTVRQGDRAFVVGRSYLIFALRIGSTWMVARQNAAEVNGDRLTPLSSDYGARFEAMSPDYVMGVVAALAAVK